MTASSASSSHWHAVTPSTRPLSLSILELTPLALTLSLTLATPFSASTAGPSNLSHALSGISPAGKKKKRPHRADSDEESTTVEPDEENNVWAIPGSWPVDIGNSFKDLLSHGVVISVNGQPWSRIVAHVADLEESDTPDNDEAEDEWDEDWDHAGARSDEEGAEEGLGSEGVQRRRPRRARFTLSAQHAAGGTTRRIGRRRERIDRDRAIVVVYGLCPGMEYEVELRVIGVGAQESDVALSNTVLIPPSPHNLLPRSRANSLRTRSNPRSRSNSMNAPAPESSASSGRETPPPQEPISSPLDTQTAQMRLMLAAATTEKEHLTTQIKDARRSSQRAEAALRQEIDVVKKAVEKAGSLDLRAKQKALALQEQVKQAWAGSESAEKEMQTVEAGMSDLDARMEAVRMELESCKDDMKRARDREEEAKERDRRARQEEEKKLGEVVSRVEKLRMKKERRESEKAELEKRIQDLEKQREEVERRGEEEARRRLGEWDHDHGHRLAAHPSLNNLGYGFRPRPVGYQPRFPSAGTARQSPTHATFSQPTFRPPVKPAVRPTGAGTNASAAPFVPGNYDSSHHTTLMPPGMQHRIYLPNTQNVRPRPTPNFHPPPSVVAEQAAQAQARSSPTTTSQPAFPPLPGSTASKQNMPSGPSLASIVTKAVLSPTSTLGGRPSPPMQGVPASPSSSTPTPPVSGHSIPLNQRVTFGPPPTQERAEFPPLSPTGPWASLNPSIGAKARGELERRSSGDVHAFGMERTQTPLNQGWSGHERVGSRKNTE